jgi:DNA gyrase subunit A
VNTIRETNRGAKGVRLVTLEPGDKLLSVARIVETPEEAGIDVLPPTAAAT